MYGLMVTFDPTRATSVSGRRNEGLNFGNVVAKSKVTWDRYHGGGGGIKIKLDLCHYLGGALKRNCQKRAEEKEKIIKDDSGADDRRADGVIDVKGGQLHTIFKSSVNVQSGIDFSEMVEEEEFTWHQFHVEG